MTWPPPPRPAPLVLRGRTFDASRPAVMAIINRTPDSFYAPGRHHLLDEALRRLDDVIEKGADIIDVGGVRAGGEGAAVDVAEEIERVAPFLQEARRRHPDVILSLDTWRAAVVRACAGLVDLVNDTWAGHDPAIYDAAAEAGAGLVISHTGGLPPRTDPVNISYGHEEDRGVVDDVLRGLGHDAARAASAGIPRERILLDPTLDFGKTTRHSLAVLRASDRVVDLGFPVMQAISRKDVIGESLGLPAEERLNGSLAATAIAAWLGVSVFRTHDVRATREVLDMVAVIRGDRAPRRASRGVPQGPEVTTLRHPCADARSPLSDRARRRGSP